jgi:hypothetical protein
MTRRLTLPELVLQELGVDRPQDLDLEAVAWELGARVRYRELHSCEARIVGRGDRAIITVDARKPPTRQRFSIAHELGHWCHHRGACLICRSEDIGNRRRTATDPERVADDYASDLLIPRYLLDPLLREISRPTLKVVRDLAETFKASLTATAIKIAENDRFPMIIVCHGQDKRRWFRRSPSVPDRWFPRDELAHESYAFDLLFNGGEEQVVPRKVDADDWFDRAGADRFQVTEQSYKVPGDQVVTILHLTDPEMTIEWGSRHRP